MKNKKIKFVDPIPGKEETYNEDFEDGQENNNKKWYEELTKSPSTFNPVTEGTLIDLKAEAKKIYDAEVAAYNIKNSKTNNNYKWMKGIMSKGTTSDKLAAYVVLIQDNPVYNLNTLQNCIGMVKAGKKKDCLTAMQNLTELFLSDLLIPDQKLKAFHQKPLSQLTQMSSGNISTRKKILTYWYFEDQLKEAYTSFVLALNAVAHDTVDANKEKAIAAMFKLLAGNPEQEKNLLMHIVNKLGDPSQKVASKSIYCLTQLLRKHSNMQGVVLNEVEKLLFRPNIGTRAQYYGICFLSQFILNHEDSEVAKHLIEVYFSFFKACIKKGEVDSRMMSALLMGVNRAYPYAKMQLNNNSEHIQTMYRIVHIANFNVSLHALSLLYQVSDFANNVNDRFYSALYRKLLDTRLLKTTHQALLLNLVYKALMKDNEPNRIKVFIKRLLQVASHVLPNFACGILFLVSQIITKKDILTLEFIPIKSEIFDIDDEGEEKYVDIKDEPEEEEINTKKQETTNQEEQNKNANGNENENLEEKEKEEGEEGQKTLIDLSEIEVKPDVKPGWYHLDTIKKETNVKEVTEYKPLARNPLYAGGEFSNYVELNELKNHYHPSVSLFANQILNGETIVYSGDPLKDFTIIRFLDRFVFKNPKKREDVMKQGSHPTFGKRKQYLPSGLRSLSVTSNHYLNESESNIPAEERFMYKYLQKRRQAIELKKEQDDNSDLESVASEEFEELLDKMGGVDNEVDEDFDDLDFDEDVKENLQKSKAKKKNKAKQGDDEEDDDENPEEDDDDEDFEDIDEDDDLDSLNGEDDDLDLAEEDDEDIDDLGGEDDDDDDDEEEEDMDLDDDEDDDTFIKKDLNKKQQNKLQKKKFKKNTESDFAPAEEFAALLEDEGASMFKPGGANAYKNSDKSAAKQIAWEDRRNHWLNKNGKGNKNKNANDRKRKAGKKTQNQGQSGRKKSKRT